MEVKVSREIGIQYSLQPWIRCTPVSIKKKPSTTWINPEWQCTRILGKHIKIQYMGVIWSLLRGKDGSSIKHDLTQSLFYNTLRAICTEKNGTHEDWRRLAQQSTLNLRGYREQPYSRLICTMDVRIFLIRKARTSADHQSKRSEVYDETLSAKFEETRSGNIDFRIQRLPHSTVQKEDYDRSNGEETDPPIWYTPEPWLVDGAFEQDWGNSISSAKSRRSWSAAWVTRSTWCCARSLLNYNAQIVLYIGLLASFFAPAAKRLQPSERNRQLNKDRYDVLSFSRLRHWKESVPWRQTWTNYAAVYVPQSTRHAQESPEETVQCHLGEVVQRLSLPRFFVKSWMEWRKYNGIRQDRIRGPFLHRQEKKNVGTRTHGSSH